MTSPATQHPRAVEARLLTRENGAQLWEWADSKPHYGPDREVDGLTIWTPDGRVKADFGDWIVKDENGAFWPVKPDTFASADGERRL
jgi:hypothetical protein